MNDAIPLEAAMGFIFIITIALIQHFTGHHVSANTETQRRLTLIEVQFRAIEVGQTFSFHGLSFRKLDDLFACSNYNTTAKTCADVLPTELYPFFETELVQVAA